MGHRGAPAARQSRADRAERRRVAPDGAAQRHRRSQVAARTRRRHRRPLVERRRRCRGAPPRGGTWPSRAGATAAGCGCGSGDPRQRAPRGTGRMGGILQAVRDRAAPQESRAEPVIAQAGSESRMPGVPRLQSVTWKSYVRYLWPLRVPVFVASAVCGLPWFALSSVFSSCLSGLFDPVTDSALVLITAVALFNAWTVVIIAGLILEYGNARLDLPPVRAKMFPLHRTWWVASTVVVAGPVVWQTV